MGCQNDATKRDIKVMHNSICRPRYFPSVLGILLFPRNIVRYIIALICPCFFDPPLIGLQNLCANMMIKISRKFQRIVFFELSHGKHIVPLTLQTVLLQLIEKYNFLKLNYVLKPTGDKI